MKTQKNFGIYLVTVALLLPVCMNAQQITGVWQGKTKSTKIELKLIKSGDSLVGNAYYYVSKLRYKKYSVKGYFDPGTNNVIWWDDVMLEDKLSGNQEALLSVADFNCPGEDEMRLDGNSSLRDDKERLRNPLHLQKVKNAVFPDDWDWVIDNYTAGANDPYIIDSIGRLSTEPIYSVARNTKETEVPVTISERSVPETPASAKPESSSIEEKFARRKRTLQQVIPVSGEIVALRFYDNAQIDGDSIAIFLNNVLLFKHVRLTDQPYTVKINVNDLQDDNELVMVAENLGSIPPNTALMVVEVGGKTFDAHLYSTENSSALIRFIKTAKAEYNN